MCLAVLAWEAHPRFPLVLASNRDEFFERPTAAMQWWSPGPGAEPLLAGRDLRAGGTWLALNRRGRLALLTNVRRPAAQRPDAPSRGTLATRWLHSGEAAAPFCAPLAAAGHNAFNLLLADLGAGMPTWHWYTPGLAAPQALSPGVWGLSNAALDTPWPKVEFMKATLAGALGQAVSADTLADTLFAALRNETPVADERLPATGVPLAAERALATVFIRTADGRYGTRCSTLLITERGNDGRSRTTVIERSYAPDRSVSGERREVLPDWPPLGAGW